jgi:hypothetical protein
MPTHIGMLQFLVEYGPAAKASGPRPYRDAKYSSCQREIVDPGCRPQRLGGKNRMRGERQQGSQISTGLSTVEHHRHPACPRRLADRSDSITSSVSAINRIYSYARARCGR